jgi:hypothetical protein
MSGTRRASAKVTFMELGHCTLAVGEENGALKINGDQICFEYI